MLIRRGLVNAVTVRFGGKKKKQQRCKASVSGAKRKDGQRGKEVGRIIQSTAAGRRGGGVGRAERQQEERAPVVVRQIATHHRARLRKVTGGCVRAGVRRFDLRGD